MTINISEEAKTAEPCKRLAILDTVECFLKQNPRLAGVFKCRSRKAFPPAVYSR